LGSCSILPADSFFFNLKMPLEKDTITPTLLFSTAALQTFMLMLGNPVVCRGARKRFTVLATA
jgi:hypothetical protein